MIVNGAVDIPRPVVAPENVLLGVVTLDRCLVPQMAVSLYCAVNPAIGMSATPFGLDISGYVYLFCLPRLLSIAVFQIDPLPFALLADF